MPVIGIVSISDRETTLQATWHQTFFQRMRDLGWTPGRNISVEFRFADNKPDQLPALSSMTKDSRRAEMQICCN
jgi:hypothetical protein